MFSILFYILDKTLKGYYNPTKTTFDTNVFTSNPSPFYGNLRENEELGGPKRFLIDV